MSKWSPSLASLALPLALPLPTRHETKSRRNTYGLQLRLATLASVLGVALALHLGFGSLENES